MLLGQIKWLSDLCIISFLGCLVYFFGVLGSSTIYSFRNWNPPTNLWDMDFNNILEFSGTAIYSLEGICLVLPCERSMRVKEDAQKMVSSSLSIYAILIGLYASIAFAGGLARPECDIVTDCFEGDAEATVLRLALSFALMLSHPVTLFPASEILEEIVLGEEEGVRNYERGAKR